MVFMKKNESFNIQSKLFDQVRTALGPEESLECQIANSNLISQVNTKERTKYFNAMTHLVDDFKQQFQHIIETR